MTTAVPVTDTCGLREGENKNLVQYIVALVFRLLRGLDMYIL